MRIKLVSHTPDPLTQIYAQARMTTTRGDFDEIYHNKASTERKVQLVMDTLESGHWSVCRGVSFTFSIAGVSRACSHQLVRHVQGVSWEQQCLTADSVVTFVAQDGTSSPNLRRTVGDLYEGWHHGYNHPSQQTAIRRRRLRVLNEETNLFEVGHIEDVIYSGMQDVFTVELEDGKTLTMTKNHRIFTDEGWKTLEDAVGLVLHGMTAGMTKEARVMVNGVTGGGHDTYRDLEWMAARKSEGLTVQEIADAAGCGYANARKWLKAHGLQFSPRERHLSQVKMRGGRRSWNDGVKGYKHKTTVGDETRKKIGEARRGEKNHLWRGGVATEMELARAWARSVAPRVHAKYAYTCQKCGRRGGGLHAHHILPIWFAPDKARDFDNLISVCVPCHQEIHRSVESEQAFGQEVLADTFVVKLDPSQRKRPGPRKLKAHAVKITRVSYAGIQRTYDLSVSGNWHNFVANGLVVHNSQRYKEVDTDADWHITPPSVLGADPEKLALYEAAMRSSAEAYRRLLELGVPAEDARMVLPNAARTNLVSTWSFEALKNFLGQRLCTRAQWEAREVAKAMRKEVVGRLPWAGRFLTIKCISSGRCDEVNPGACPLLEQNGGRVPWRWEGQRELKR